MPRLGDAANRPDEDFIVVPAAPKMQAESALLSSNTLVAWFEDGRKDVPCNEVVVAFATTFGCRKEDVSVIRHLSEQFFVRFMYEHNCVHAVNRGDILVPNSKLFVRAWILEAHDDNEDMMHHIRLRIEGIFVHGWNEHVAALVIFRRCSLDYISPMAPRREDTRFLSLWVWMCDPGTVCCCTWTCSRTTPRHKTMMTTHPLRTLSSSRGSPVKSMGRPAAAAKAVTCQVMRTTIVGASRQGRIALK
ncbi:hypothetical protein ZWY2020_059072 [Hordeum vulgare]|nr:hypothetical protein ZWY2020_059072 [Hordeum vulgare]